MFKALIIEDRKKRGLILDVNFKIFLEAQTNIITSISGLKKILKGDSLPKWDLIVCRDSIEGEDVFSLLDEAIPELGYDIPIVVQVNRKKKDKLNNVEKFIYVEENGLLKNILSPVAKLFEITPTQMAKYKVPDPYPVDSSLLEYFITSPCEIFTDEDKDHCILSTGDNIDKEVLKGLLGGDVFVEASKRILFVNTFTEQFSHMAGLLGNPDIDLAQKMDALDKTLTFLSKEFQNGGMDEEVAELSHQCITSMVEITSSTKGLDDFQKLLLSDDFSERFLTAQLVIFYSLHMIKLLDWILEDPELNIPYAAFFHDLLLESDDWAVIRNNDNLKSAKLDELQKERIERHADLTAKFFETWDSVPNEACKLIREHHGSTDGRGFCNNLEGISNLAKSFLVAEEWAVSCLPFYQKKGLEKSKEKILNSLKLKFEGKGYNELIGALELLELVDLDKIVEFWQKADSLDEVERTLEIKLVESKLLTEEELGYWEVISFIHHRLELVKEQGEHLLEEGEKELSQKLLEKSSYMYRILNGIFDGQSPPVIEPEVIEQIKDCFDDYLEAAPKVYDTIQAFRLSRDLKETDLMLAASQSKITMCKFLIDNSLEEINVIDLEGKTALMFAVIANSEEIVNLLLEKGAKLDQVDRMRRGPLYHALIHGHEDLFFNLSQKGARPSQQAVGGVSLCMVCALRGHLKALEFLVKETKADLNSQDANKKTVIDYAKKGGNKEIIEFVKNNI